MSSALLSICKLRESVCENKLIIRDGRPAVIKALATARCKVASEAPWPRHRSKSWLACAAADESEASVLVIIVGSTCVMTVFRRQRLSNASSEGRQRLYVTSLLPGLGVPRCVQFKLQLVEYHSTLSAPCNTNIRGRRPTFSMARYDGSTVVMNPPGSNTA